ncbi:MAG: hypothetical protein H7338_24240 [Candidatus Sericytochromatia bacterium]|nr:hypothetical protein [Candidatus Sericytochromatia bacterium]
MDVSVVSERAVALPVDLPMPVVLILGSGCTAKALSQALPTEGFHTILAGSWSHVRSLAGFLKPDMLLLVPAQADELAWRSCFGPATPALTVSQSPEIDGLRWPLRWRTLVTALRQRIAHAPALALL